MAAPPPPYHANGDANNHGAAPATNLSVELREQPWWEKHG
jgi:hypothetical protein